MVFQVARMNEQESAAWLGLVTVCQLLPVALDSQLQRDSDMTHFEFLVLSVLKFAPDRTERMSDLARSTNATLSRLSHVCSRLEKRGLVERTASPDDRRATDVRLTSAGNRALVQAMRGHLETARHLVVDALTPEQLDQLAGITDSIRARLTGAAECDRFADADGAPIR